MISKIAEEKWKQVTFPGWETMQRKYAISTSGRLASYHTQVAKDGILLKGSDIEGYKVLRLRVKGAYVAFLFHRLVADAFCKRKTDDHNFVIHLNHKKQDNRAANIKWADKEEVATHNKNSPAVKAYRKQVLENAPNIKKGLKLSLTQVKQIKTLLINPKRKLTHKQIAEKYGISEMAITRMKRGENWGHVKV
ncbi:MAG TPA: NUMOD4 domain-containing protein [Phnomibacter sp.]|nr:NUMOD4 domain-containing protein [Phnomibacter sp.]